MSGRLRTACIVSFLNEVEHLSCFLRSLSTQRRAPDQLLLVDDGSTDGSDLVAREFVKGRHGARLLQRPRRPPSRDRLVGAPELQAFQWAVPQLDEPWDVVVKMDADLDLSVDLFETIERAFCCEPGLGIAGTYLSVVDSRSGTLVRERCPPHHARGPTKFYRRSCLEQIGPLPETLGWDTVDEIAARRQGWRTAAVACRSRDTIHLRPTGSHDGRLRAQFRWGVCAYGIGQHPFWVGASSARRMADSPPVLSSIAFLSGWVAARARGMPRAPAEIRAFGRREQLAWLRELVAR